MSPTEVRLQLLHAGFHPLPLWGKRPPFEGWQKKFDTNDQEIAMWPKQWADATNTGILTRFTPTLDIDILHPEAAQAVADLISERYEERGYPLTRTGKAPKCATPFRTDDPFAKITVDLIAPDGTNGQKLEFLADGQQVVVDGIHPDTKQPYRWHGGVPGDIARDDLPYITGAEAHQLIDDAAELLIREFGYTRPERKLNGAGDYDDGHDRADWTELVSNIIAGRALHDSAVSLAASYIASGVSAPHARRQLRALMMACTAPHDERWKARLDDLPRIVGDAEAKFGAKAQPQPELTSPAGGTALGYSWHWRAHGEVEIADSRPYLVQDVLPEVGSGVLSGQWGTYKTFVGFDLAGSAMSGKPFIGFPVRRRGGVLFFACESEAEVAIRLQAVVDAKCGPGRAPFLWVEGCPRLLDPNAPKILAAMVKQAADRMQAEFGLPVVLVIFDTAGKAAGYTREGQENDPVLGQLVVKTLASLAKEAGVFALGIDHFGKNVDVGTRGASTKEADTDVVLALLGEKGINGAVVNTRLAIRKRRTGQNGLEFPFRTKVVDMGADKNGEPITTLTIDWSAATAEASTKSPDDAWAKSLKLLRRALMNVLVDHGTDQQPFPDGPIVRAVDLEVVRAEFYKTHIPQGDNPKAKQAARRKAFHRAIKTAQEQNLIGVREFGDVTLVWLAKAPASPTQNAGLSDGHHDQL